ncbi:SGNH/GDSL hydrolase family protein [Halomicrobium salinisoli]|uniref:SGNH/GDSL hydrolase family protein n=1 Tax=Halomicrobium salinisoli TaxID=2878391 RepID=UPI001CEFE08B|nr:SGNH/GDSL hydrolase family protein [Halomicrobium salinisoli]
MSAATYPSVTLHNVAETAPADWTADGDRLCRVPASVGDDLNDDARERVRHPTHSEVRFVPETDDDEIEVTLSAPERARARVFWGSFQPWQAIEIGPTPETLSLGVPDRLRSLDESVDVGRFDPRVCRIAFERFTPAALHDVRGDCRPPAPDELPDRRYLAYGTSITEGAKASAAHLSYVSRVARNCGLDAVNLACSGSAYCEPALADYVADRDDWDVATFALSVNMANAGFSPSEFRERADYFVNTVADAHPEKPIACVTLFPYYADVAEEGDADVAAAYRDVLRSVVEDSPHDNLSLVAGTDLLSASELTWDVLHPGDGGMESIGDGLARHLETRLD